MKVKAPFVIQISRQNSNDDWNFVQAGYTVRQYLSHTHLVGRRRRWVRWWLWGYVGSENRLLSAKELAL